MFVKRNEAGVIVAAWSSPQTDRQRRDGEDRSPDWLPDDHPDLVAFLAPPPPPEDPA